MAQNLKYFNEIRKWNKEELGNVLYMNGLNDCVDAIRELDIDGETFLNLTEGQLNFWRKYLNNVQIRRLWSVIQLARDKPKEFVGNFQSLPSNNPATTSSSEIERSHAPIARSLENILGQKSGAVPAKTTKQGEVIYENMETILQAQRELAYKLLPPKPTQQRQQQQPQPQQTQPKQQQQNTIITPVPTENENKKIQNKFAPKPVQTVQPLIQNTNIIKFKREAPVPVPASMPITTTTNEVPNVLIPSNSNNATNNHRTIPSPNNNNRPLPLPPKSEITLPKPPPNIPSVASSDEEEFPIYYDVDHYTTKSWYSEIDRNKANDLLKGKPNGTFLARPSKRGNNECSLSIVYNDRIYNVAVMKEDNKFIIGNHEFNSVNEIVDFFMKNEMVLNGHNNEDIVVTLRQL